MDDLLVETLAWAAHAVWWERNPRGTGWGDIPAVDEAIRVFVMNLPASIKSLVKAEYDRRMEASAWR